MKENRKTESLTEIVFRYRHKEYGSYLLRRKYLKTLVMAASLSIAAFLLIFLVPFVIYYLHDTELELDSRYMYSVEYIPFLPPDDVILVELAKIHAQPPEEQTQTPVVSDSITGKEKPSRESRKDERQTNADTASYGTGGEVIGRQQATDTAMATTIDVYPRYPGSDEARLVYLRRNIRYPKEAIDSNIQGVVFILFMVEADGSITHINITQGIGGGCDEEALRVTREMPRWSPGKRSGRPVRVMVKMPVIFRLPPKQHGQ